MSRLTDIAMALAQAEKVADLTAQVTQARTELARMLTALEAPSAQPIPLAAWDQQRGHLPSGKALVTWAEQGRPGVAECLTRSGRRWIVDRQKVEALAAAGGLAAGWKPPVTTSRGRVSKPFTGDILPPSRGRRSKSSE